MPIAHNSLVSLQDSVNSLVREGNLETALEIIQAFVERIVYDPLATGRVFSASALDELCLRVGAQVLSQMNLVSPAPMERRIAYVATEFYRTGGHTLVAADFVRNLPGHEHVFLLTDVLGNPHRDAADLRLVPLGAQVEIAPTGPRLERLKWLLARISELAPERIYWFNHHQDAVAIAAAQPAIPGDKYFIHHGDHNLCLGVHTPHLRHVDLTNLGFFNCRNTLGLTDNRHWPLVSDDLGPRDQKRRFIHAGRLRTCSSGNDNKFETLYLYNYVDILPRILSSTGGDHVHVGFLSEKYLERIRCRLAAADIPQERFIHVPWVPSLWRALIERDVDVYLMSWPIGGGKALIEAMGAGIPSIIHVNYISRYHSGFDVGHADAPTWRTPTELADLLCGFTPASLASQSVLARAHYEKHHAPATLASLLRGEGGAEPAPVPLRDYKPDGLQTFLDDRAQRNSQFANLNRAVAERDGQIASLRQAVARRDGQIASLNQAVAERDGQIRLIVNSRSWKVTRPLRFALRLVRDGLTNNDRQRITQKLRNYFHRLPLPVPAKRFASLAYHGLRRVVFRTTRHCAPTIKPLARQKDLPDYIVWGVIPWHFRHQRPQQISMELARARRRVFYVSPNLVDDDRAGFQAEALDSSGLLFQVNLFAKGAPEIYSQPPTLPLVNQLRASIGEVLEWGDCERIVSLVQHPFWCDVASALPNRELVYDCMDHHEGFGGMGEDLTRLEKQLFHDSDLTVTTSAWLDQSVATHAQYRVMIRNATDYEFFSQAPESTYRDPQGRRIIGYYGAIAEWLDLDLVEAVAQQHPECSVMMIGADTVHAKYRLEKLPNVTCIGEVPYRKLPHYLYSFDVCLLPFKVGPLTLATNPVKVYEYLSAGKPVVANDLPEMAQFDGLVYVAAKQKQFLETVGLLLATPESRDLIQRRKDFAQGQTWRHRVEALIQQAESSDREVRISVIVVTYDNIDLTRACLASIDEHSQYDNLEVIVVDNASSDGSREFLERWASVGDSRKLILNDRNRGFAAANNQGLNVATGDFLVMLNNDTYVTPGWVRSLVNHLKRDKTIGLIGPVTNNIGNEAKIDIGYGDMSEMLAKSAAFTRRHIGRLYPLRTVAFFCVMMQRETFERVGLLDEAFGRGWFEDDDYCRRAEQVGLRIVCAEDVFVHHHLSASFNKLKQQDREELFEENKKIYEAKWGAWIPHGYRQNRQLAISDPIVPEMYGDWRYVSGCCNVCGKLSRFFYKEVELWRESLNCEHCHTTSRYRSIAQGILRAISELTGIEASALAMLPQVSTKKLHVYDTQAPFYGGSCAYPLPDLLKATGWIEVELSQYKPNKPIGEVLAGGVTNQNLECLTFSDESLDLVITSDVMEHVRLDALAHREIYRVLKPGGIYIFTVPHDRSLEQTMIRVQVNDPNDSKKDVHLLEPEYHGDANSDGSTGVLSYRVYGRDLESYLSRLGFEIEYSRKDIANFGILNTELYYCRRKPADAKFGLENG